MDKIFFSIIIPVYNRPEEVNELLESLTLQTYHPFEVIIVEDGSKKELSCETVALQFSKKLSIHYFYKENSGQGFTRNFAFEKAKGNYFIIFDSDIIVPPKYLQIVNEAIIAEGLDAFGGPDASSPDFNDIQKAISYSMTSVFTTGGIRGRKKHVGQFHPRSFNMGLSRKVYEKVGGFTITRMAEDLEFSIRIIRAGFKVRLIENAFVYHKRRSDFKQFFRQLHFFGRARINLSRFYPDELKLVHFFPMLFTLGLFIIPLLYLISLPLFFTGLSLITIFCFLIFIDSFVKNKFSIKVAFLSIIAAFTQLTAYGFGFIGEGVKKIFERKKK